MKFPATIISGPFDESLAGLVTSHGWSRVAVITGSSFEANTDFTPRTTRAVAVEIRRWDRGAAHAEVERVEEIAGEMREFRPDAIVSGGGGSSHDVAKGVAVLLANGGSLLDHCLVFRPPDNLQFHPLPGPKLPIVTVPSTFSGSEANGAAGYIPAGWTGKRVIADPTLTPVAVLIDETVFATTPRDILLGSAMNALNHCVEGIASRLRQPVSNFLLRSALRELATSTQGVAGGYSANGVVQAGIASAVTGAGMSGTWLGIAHALGHILGARYRVPHGWCHAVLAGAAIRWNASVAGPLHEEAARTLGLDGGSEALATWMEARAKAWGLPSRLSDLGVQESDIQEIAEAAWWDHDTYFNPRRPESPDEIASLLRTVQ